MLRFLAAARDTTLSALISGYIREGLARDMTGRAKARYKEAMELLQDL